MSKKKKVMYLIGVLFVVYIFYALLSVFWAEKICIQDITPKCSGQALDDSAQCWGMRLYSTTMWGYITPICYSPYIQLFKGWKVPSWDGTFSL